MNLGPLLPTLPAAGPCIEFHGLTSAIRWSLGVLLVATGAPLALAAIGSARRGFPELVGSLTAGTFAEPLGNALLDALAGVSWLIWYVSDALLAARASRADG